MPLENLISLTFSAAELQTFDDALTALETVLRPKAINLTPEERQPLRTSPAPPSFTKTSSSSFPAGGHRAGQNEVTE